MRQRPARRLMPLLHGRGPGAPHAATDICNPIWGLLTTSKCRNHECRCRRAAEARPVLFLSLATSFVQKCAVLPYVFLQTWTSPPEHPNRAWGIHRLPTPTHVRAHACMRTHEALPGAINTATAAAARSSSSSGSPPPRATPSRSSSSPSPSFTPSWRRQWAGAASSG